jgi:hypothetical protein
VSAELAARRTAAAAALADFRAAEAAFERGLRNRPAYPAWALRLEQHLRYVLADLDAQDVVVGAGLVILTAAQYAIVAQALADAETYRLQRAAAWCEDCKTHPAGACEEHLDDLDAATAYHETGGELAREAGR